MNLVDWFDSCSETTLPSAIWLHLDIQHVLTFTNEASLVSPNYGVRSRNFVLITTKGVGLPTDILYGGEHRSAKDLKERRKE